MNRTFAVLLSLILLLSVFAGCSDRSDGHAAKETDSTEGASQPANGPGEEFAVPADAAQSVQDNYRVFYEIFVGSFSDSNGDGIGDLRGIIRRLDYLNDGDDSSGKSLGVEGLWLTPIFASDSYHKYDVNDYYSVDSDFGTLEDLKELVDLCHQRNVKVILDLPINHTSRSNSWFKSFSQAHQNQDPEDPYYDFYCCYSQGETAPVGRTFARLSGTDVYYECNFDSGMPELNYDNEAVRQAVLDVARFYLELGIDGFRFDAAKYIYFGDNSASAEFWSWYMEQLRYIKPDIYTVAEVWDTDGIVSQYYPALNCFNFTASQAEGLIAKTAQGGDVSRYVSYVDSYLDSIAGTNPDAMPVPFIANHDTDRAAGYLSTATGRAQMGANLLLLGPGSPFLYYGEEIAMRGSRGSANTDANRRLHMVWGDGDTVSDPVGATYDPSNRADSPVAEQLSRENSLYNYYKKVILLRKSNPEIARGDYTALNLSGVKAGGFVSEWQGKRVCVLHNTSDSDVTLDLSKYGSLSEFSVISGFVGLGEASLAGTVLTLGGQTSVVLR